MGVHLDLDRPLDSLAAGHLSGILHGITLDFELELHGLTRYREKQWTTWQHEHRHQIAKRIVGGVLKILSVRCPNPQCAERFALIVGILLSGILTSITKRSEEYFLC